jgi:hypothetical protein
LDAAIRQMQDDPFAGDVERLTHERAAFHRGVGDWRIFFEPAAR